MAWRDEIYIVTAHPLKFQHDVGKLNCRNHIAIACVAYIVVLAEDATEVTASKKDRS
jgi:hypothetical protein